MVLICDAGNTQVKIACFNQGELIDLQRFDLSDEAGIRAYYQASAPNQTFVCSVLGEEANERLHYLLNQPLFFNASTRLPIPNQYLSETLGKDRIANAVAIHYLKKTTTAVAIDLGTCIKFDCLSAELGYLGGSISPGIRLRYQALNNFTEQLPLINRKENYTLIGNTTESSIVNGVMKGIEQEVNGMIESYEKQFPSLTFFVTGGDAKHFDFHSKKDIFVVENLTLIGLYQIYLFNA